MKLSAVVEDASCVESYTWSANGGRVVGEGPEVAWNFNDTRPDGKYYDVTLTVKSKSGCRAPKRMVSEPARVVAWGGCPGLTDATADRPPPVPVAVATAPAARPCPGISLCCRASATASNLTPFSASLSGLAPGVEPRFKWTVSGGTVVEGQNTASILVDTKGFSGGTFLTRVELENYPGCSSTCNTTVTECPDPTVNVKVSYKNERGVTAAVPNAKVLFFLDGRSVGGSVADAGGNVRREGLTPGEYRIVASADTFGESESTINLDRCKSGDVAISLKEDTCVWRSRLVRQRVRRPIRRLIRPVAFISRTRHRRPRYTLVWERKCFKRGQTWASASSAEALTKP